MKALLGFERNLTHLDGHIVPLVRKGVTQPGAYTYILPRINVEVALLKVSLKRSKGRECQYLASLRMGISL